MQLKESSHENASEAILTKEITIALSPVWEKSVQELLPGRLPPKEYHEYTVEELTLFKTTYKILAKMVEDGTVDVIFEETEKTSNEDAGTYEKVSRPRFKLHPTNGKTRRGDLFFRIRKPCLSAIAI